jgi:predicted AlkP superfamily pyrophosphatase or phosphodiesterase
MSLPTPERVVIIDIDGLRADVFQQVLDTGRVPNFLRLVRTEGLSTAHTVAAVSVAPSITFAAQASIFTGVHPAQHRVAGNQLFDRFGVISKGEPSYLGFDVGDTMAYDDAVEVFRSGLADRFLNPNTPTIYESALGHNKISWVAFNMYARGAVKALRPGLVDIARFTKGKGIFGLSAEAFDRRMLGELEEALKDADPKPDLITAYFMGLDHYSHEHGPDAQPEYLQQTLDELIGRLIDLLEQEGCSPTRSS